MFKYTPKGFSVPSITDFHTLFFNLGGIDKAQEVLTNYVGYTPNEDYLEVGLIDDLVEGNNSIGFNANPGGSAYSSSYPEEGLFNAWWTNSKIAED
ncbi:FISUMP domain-containing protein [Aequorivita sp. KMM 9714]|uniref:FISUMP domain-containing protein n=1 Tax=Aequorivita sp. KMM 9714 TaxID=2707173 RepID=UPI0013EE0514|nr:FISUMP domain-containing protein [Aequorivita sp. KMM 9714]NGX85145.1 hypothetical protein [Aequorivita sp. KMM 9714]